MFYFLVFFFFNDTATTEIYTLSLHDALPIDVLAARGEHDDRHLRFRADLAAQAEAVLTRQHYVEDEKVDAMVSHSPDHFTSVGRRRHVAGVGAQVLRNQRPRLAVVFNDKNVRRCHGHADPLPPIRKIDEGFLFRNVSDLAFAT